MSEIVTDDVISTEVPKGTKRRDLIQIWHKLAANEEISPLGHFAPSVEMTRNALLNNKPVSFNTVNYYWGSQSKTKRSVYRHLLRLCEER